ncbi:MAG: response regulator [Candidatus Aminicenantes bacterium]|nr:response regulator [Candidatus Aminicenantes bacterium]
MTNLKKKILIIDPDNNDRDSLLTFLQDNEYHVDTGYGLADAIKNITAKHYHCVIMAVELPEMKGYEAVSIIKKIDSEIKVIMTTRKNTKQLEAKVREQDIFFYFIKSFGKEELKLAINNAFNK